MGNRAILDDSPVDEDVLRSARRSRCLSRARGNEPGQPESAGILAHFDEVVPLAVNLEESIVNRTSRRALQNWSRGTRQREPDARVCKRELGRYPGHLGGLSSVGFQE